MSVCIFVSVVVATVSVCVVVSVCVASQSVAVVGYCAAVSPLLGVYNVAPRALVVVLLLYLCLWSIFGFCFVVG